MRRNGLSSAHKGSISRRMPPGGDGGGCGAFAGAATVAIGAGRIPGGPYAPAPAGAGQVWSTIHGPERPASRSERGSGGGGSSAERREARA